MTHLQSPQTASQNQEFEEEIEPPARKKVKGGKKKSGYYAKVGNSRIVSNELFAHAALEDELGDRDLASLSFNLFVAGELEIISDDRISKAEHKKLDWKC